MEGVHVIHVVSKPTWGIDYKGQRFGPYPDRDKALATARMWSENATKQGHIVRILVDGEADEIPASDGEKKMIRL